MAEDLFSPGLAMSKRATLERDFDLFVTDSVEGFLREVIGMVGPRNQLSSGQVHGAWFTVVHRVQAFTASYMGFEDPLDGRPVTNDYLRAQKARLTMDPLPDLVYSTARSVLAENRGPAALRQALSLDTGSTVLTAGLGVIGRAWRAIVSLFVRTESTAMKNTVTMFKLLEKGIANKKWVAHHDERVRFTHGEVDGQVRPLNQPFQVGTALLQYPGEERGPAQEVFNCRCVIVGAK